MTRYLILTVVFFFTLSCSKENHNNEDVLNITYKSTELDISYVNMEIVIYPNPFMSSVFVYLPNDQGNVIISDKNGNFKKIEITDSRFALGFDDCPKGVYYMEIFLNNKVYRKTLIKE